MTPKYEQLAETLRQTLPQWYADGQRKLPCEQALAAQFSVSRRHSGRHCLFWSGTGFWKSGGGAAASFVRRRQSSTGALL